MSDSPEAAAGKAPWRDRVAQVTLVLAVALNLLLFILVLLAGGAFSTPSNALILPIIGLVAWLVGAVLGYFFYKVRDEAPVAYIVWGAVVFIELATWAPILSMILGT